MFQDIKEHLPGCTTRHRRFSPKELKFGRKEEESEPKGKKEGHEEDKLQTAVHRKLDEAENYRALYDPDRHTAQRIKEGYLKGG